MKNIACLFAVFSVLLFSAHPCRALGVEAAVGGWVQDPGGEFGYKSVDSIDLADEAGFDAETKAMLRVNFDMPLILPNIYALYTPMDFGGNGDKANSFSFGGTTFNANDKFDATLSLDHFDLALYYGVPLLQTATLNTLKVDFGINVRLLKVEAEVKQSASLKDSFSEDLLLPMGFLAVKVSPTDSFSLTLEGRGTAYSGSHYYDLIGRLRYNFFGPLFAAAGWRTEDILISDKDIEATLDVSGPFFEMGAELSLF